MLSLQSRRPRNRQKDAVGASRLLKNNPNLAYFEKVEPDIDGDTPGTEDKYNCDAGSFGSSVATNDNGSRIIVGSPSGHYYAALGMVTILYNQNSSGEEVWVEFGTIDERVSGFGSAVEMNSNGNRVFVLKRIDQMNALSYVSSYELDESTGEPTRHQIGQKLFEFSPGCSGFCPGRH